jgi:hypothetical protein
MMRSPIESADSRQPDNLAADQLVNASELRRRLRQCGNPLAVAALAGAMVLPNVDTLVAVSELGARNVEIIAGQVPQLDFREATANEALQKTYQAFNLYGGYYINDLGETSGFANTWHQYQLLNMLDVADVLKPDGGYDTKLVKALQAVDSYWNDSPQGYPAGYDASRNFGFTKPDRYVDDNLWMAQLLLRQYHKTDDPADLAKVKQIVDLFISQSDPVGGGAYWKVQLPYEADHGRVMASNATAIPTLVDMYKAGDGDASYLTTAELTFDWVQQLYDPDSGLYFDNIGPNGQIDRTFYTYNQAEVLYAMVELSEVDPAGHPLNDAAAFAQTTMDYFAQHNSYRISKFDVIYLEALMRLAAKIDDAAFTADALHAVALAKAAIPDSLTELPDASSAAAIIALSELPFARWAAV